MGNLNYGVDVLWVSRAELPKEWGTKPHVHETFYHLTYVISGSGTWYVNGTEYRGEKGTCVNVPANVSHNVITKESICEIYEIKYAVSVPELERDLRACNCVFAGDELLEHLIASIFELSKSRSLRARNTGNSFLSSMVYHILQVASPEEESEEAGTFLNMKNYSPATRMTAAYIDRNYMHEVSLESIAEETGYSRNYICTAFKRDCGFTVNTYLNYVRVFHAAEMISYGDYTLQHICTAVGFNDLSYFVKTFKKIVGIPPGQYRQAFPDNIFISGDVDKNQAGYTIPVWAGRLFQKE